MCIYIHVSVEMLSLLVCSSEKYDNTFQIIEQETEHLNNLSTYLY